MGYVTSPWYHPEKNKYCYGLCTLRRNLNARGFPIGNFGKKYKVHLPKKYSIKPVKAVVVPIPFTQSFNANTRESEVLAALNK